MQVPFNELCLTMQYLDAKGLQSIINYLLLIERRTPEFQATFTTACSGCSRVVPCMLDAQPFSLFLFFQHLYFLSKFLVHVPQV